MDSLKEEDASKPKTRSRSSVNIKTIDTDTVVSYDARKKKLHANEHNVRARIKKVHEKLRPFECNNCEQTFGHKSNLSRHKKNAHRSKKN